MKEKLLKALEAIRTQKHHLIRNQQYEEAARLRDEERKILEQIPWEQEAEKNLEGEIKMVLANEDGSDQELQYTIVLQKCLQQKDLESILIRLNKQIRLDPISLHEGIEQFWHLKAKCGNPVIQEEWLFHIYRKQLVRVYTFSKNTIFSPKEEEMISMIVSAMGWHFSVK